MTIPNIALFAGNRKWMRDDTRHLYESSDGWVITDYDLCQLDLEEWKRLRAMLLEATSGQDAVVAVITPRAH